MKTYNCTVQLGANMGGPNPHHEVPRFRVPRGEVMLLRAIHGSDAVTSIVHIGETVKPDMDVYKDMAEFYPKYVGLIEKLFGVSLAIAGNDATQLDAGLDDDPDAGEGVTHVSDMPEPTTVAPIPDIINRQPVDELA